MIGVILSVKVIDTVENEKVIIAAGNSAVL
jgi:hypothetical protein